MIEFARQTLCAHFLFPHLISKTCENHLLKFSVVSILSSQRGNYSITEGFHVHVERTSYSTQCIRYTVCRIFIY